jgi:hypothetical protein
MEIHDRKSTSYVCSLDPLSCVDMEILNSIKRSVKVLNNSARWEWIEGPDGRPGFRAVKRGKRVTIKGREPIEKVNGKGYNWSGDIVGGLANAQRIDVYIHDDRRWK